jgi:DNA-binding NarL/FixJ family response regulator
MARVLDDYRLGDGDGAEFTTRALERRPELRVIMMTGSADESVVAAARDAGCSGSVTKGDGFDTMLAAIERAMSGEAADQFHVAVRPRQTFERADLEDPLPPA